MHVHARKHTHTHVHTSQTAQHAQTCVISVLYLLNHERANGAAVPRRANRILKCSAGLRNFKTN